MKLNYALATTLLLTFFFLFHLLLSSQSGEELFLQNCAECHQEDGRGISNVYPALAGNELVLGNGVDVALVLIIGRGEMPSFVGAMSSTEMARVVNYVRNAFGNQGELISAEVIQSLD